MNQNKCSCFAKNVIKAYCKKCNKYICVDCQVVEHLDHDSDIVNLPEKITKTLCEYQKLASMVNMISERRQTHIKKESVKDIVEELKRDLIKAKEDFQKDIAKSLNETIDYFPNSPLIKEFERTKTELSGTPDDSINTLKDDLNKFCSMLLQELLKDRYRTADELLSSKDLAKYQDELEKINKLSSRDMDYIQELGKLKRTKIQYAYDPTAILGMIKVGTDIKRANRVLQFDREKNKMNIYYIETKKAVSSDINSGLVLPYRFVAIEVANTIFIIGGDNDHGYYLKSISSFDEIRGVLIALADMVELRSRHSLCSSDNYIFAIGGENSTGALDTCEKYDIKENVWKKMPKLNEKRCGHSSCVLERYIYIAFGWNDCYLNSIERLNIDEEKKWKVLKIGELPKLQGVGMIPIGEHKILLFGGYEKDEKLIKTSYVWNVKEKSLTMKKELPEAEMFLPSEVKMVGDIVYSFGYMKGGLYTYDTISENWNFITQENIPL